MRKNIVGNNLRMIRERLGITQEDPALKSGLTQGYINFPENGKRGYGERSLEKIANALGIQHCPVRFLRVLFHCSKAVIPACFPVFTRTSLAGIQEGRASGYPIKAFGYDKSWYMQIPNRTMPSGFRYQDSLKKR